MLDYKYGELSACLREELSEKRLCLSTDGFTNVNHESVINYLATAQGKSFFLEAVQTGKVSHTGEMLAKDVERIISTHSHFQVAGVVTDNTSANKVAWSLLQTKYPDKHFYGNLLFEFLSQSFFRMCLTRFAPPCKRSPG